MQKYRFRIEAWAAACGKHQRLGDQSPMMLLDDFLLKEILKVVLKVPVKQPPNTSEEIPEFDPMAQTWGTVLIYGRRYSGKTVCLESIRNYLAPCLDRSVHAFDDVMENSFYEGPDIREMIMLSRHLRFVVLTTLTNEIPISLRHNADWLICVRDDAPHRRSNIFRFVQHHIKGYTTDTLDDIFEECTQNYDCVVFNLHPNITGTPFYYMDGSEMLRWSQMDTPE